MNKKKTNTNKGITLIALVITVIVLLILAGTAISIAVNGGNIFAKANTAVESYNAKANEEKTTIDTLETNFNTYYTNYNPNQTTYAAYTVGQEVKIGTGANAQYFYVLEDSDSTQSTITLLAKYNLSNQATDGHYMQAANTSYEDTACRFSNTNYWAQGTPSTWSTYYDPNDDGWTPCPKVTPSMQNHWNGSIWTKAKLDLNNVTIPTTGEDAETLATNAILKARDYATAVGGSAASGRLLTYEEAIEGATYSDYLDEWGFTDSKRAEMIWGTANNLLYWLSSANQGSGTAVSLVYGSSASLNVERFDYDSRCGVRPVIAVSKSIVTPAT